MPRQRALSTFATVFAAASLVAVVSGVLIAAQSGAPARSWAPNLVAWLVGLAAFAVVARTSGRVTFIAVALAAVVALGLTLVAPGLQGVHRWLQVGPVRLNAAELLAASLVVVLSAAGLRRAWTWLAGGAALALLVIQPDASQATAVALGLIPVLWLSPEPRIARLAAAAAALAAAGAAWLRPDPLAPVPEVEGILRLASAWSPLAFIVAAAALATASVSPMIVGGVAWARRPEALGLSAYLVAAAVAPLLGAFPTPWVGMGVSPILGSWLGAGVLVALASGRGTARAP